MSVNPRNSASSAPKISHLFDLSGDSHTKSNGRFYSWHLKSSVSLPDTFWVVQFVESTVFIEKGGWISKDGSCDKI